MKKLRPQAKRTASDISTPIGTALQRRLKIQKSNFQTAFSCLQPNWRAWILYVQKAATDEQNADMQRILDVYNGLSRREQQSASPEYICDVAGVSHRALMEGISGLIYEAGEFQATIYKAAYLPRVIQQTAKSAMKSSPRDRETFLKMTGALPTARGTTIVNNPQAFAASKSDGRPAVLHSAGSKVLEYDQLEDDNDGSGGSSV